VMKVSATNVDRRDVERMYNRLTIRQLQQLAPFVSSCCRLTGIQSSIATDLRDPYSLHSWSIGCLQNVQMAVAFDRLVDVTLS